MSTEGHRGPHHTTQWDHSTPHTYNPFTVSSQHTASQVRSVSSKPMDDYYLSEDVPYGLLEQWKILKMMLDGAGQTSAEHMGKGTEIMPGRARSHRLSSTGTTLTASANLDEYFLQRQARDEDDDRGTVPFARSASCSTSSSSASAYSRHRRYERLVTAYRGVSDPYERPLEMERQRRFMQESKRLGNPLVLGGRRALEQPTRMLLCDCITALYRSIEGDWRDATPVVLSTSEDLIVVYFHLKKLKMRHASVLLSYMNSCLKHNEAVRQYGLTKVPEGWDVLTEDGCLMYTLRPVWVKKRTFLPDTVVPPKAHVPW